MAAGLQETADALLAALEAQGSDANRAGMARFGIAVDRAYGISIPVLRAMAKPHRHDHALAAALWASGRHEARILAGYVDDPAAVTPVQIDAWAAEFDSWDLCDQVSADLFAATPHAVEAVSRLAADEREFVRRSGFALAAALAVRGKTVPDGTFVAFLDLAVSHARDGRNFVKKAVHWAMRQIGKRSLGLHAEALARGRRLAEDTDPVARWVGREVVRELSAERTIARVAAKGTSRGKADG